jgi:hypothetical protein
MLGSLPAFVTRAMTSKNGFIHSGRAAEIADAVRASGMFSPMVSQLVLTVLAYRIAAEKFLPDSAKRALDEKLAKMQEADASIEETTAAYFTVLEEHGLKEDVNEASRLLSAQSARTIIDVVCGPNDGLGRRYWQ